MQKRDSSNRSDMVIAPYLAALSLIVYIIGILICYEGNPRTLISNLLFAVPVLIASFILVRAYAAHNKNLMKSLIGFVLSGLVLLSMHYAFSYFDPTVWYCNVKAILFLIIALFTVNQFLLSNDHYSQPAVLFANQVLMDLMAAIGLVSALADAVLNRENPLVFVCLLIFLFSTMAMILDMEMKVNEYKLHREMHGYVFVKSRTGEEIPDEEDLFISDSLFYSLPWVVLVGLALLICFNGMFDQVVTWGYSIRYLFFVVRFVCLFTLVHAYRTHNKDVMKVMLGFLLGTLLFENICEVTFISTSAVTTLKSVATMAMVLVNVVFVVLHLQLTRTHASNTTVMNLMKIAFAVYAVLTVLTAVDCSIYYILAKGQNYYFFVFKPVIWILGTFPVITGILTIDTRVNGFKVKREQRQKNARV